MVKPWLWRPTSQAVALRNARHAAAELAQHRHEREDVEAFLERHLQNRRPHLVA